MSKSFRMLRNALGIGFAAGILFSLLFLSGFFETLELKTLDFRFHSFSGKTAPSRDIVIVSIDQNSIDYLKYKMGIYWKWPRDVYADVIDYLADSGAKAILLDFDFSDPDIGRADFEDGVTDRALAGSVKKAGMVINSATVYLEAPKRKYEGEGTGFEAFKKFRLDLEGKERISIRENRYAVLPLPMLMDGSRGVGFDNVFPDRDGIIRRIRLFHRLGKDIYPSSSLSLVLAFTGKKGLRIASGPDLILNGRTIKLNRKGEIYINWYGPQGTYEYLPISDVFLSYLRKRDGHPPIISPDRFRNKIILIGSSAPSLYDLKPTPFSEHGEAYPGVEIVATTANNLIDGTALSRMGTAVTVFWILAACLLAALLVSLVKSVWKDVLLVIALSAGVYALAVIEFYHNVFFNLVPVESGIFFTFMGMVLLNYFTEGREKRWLKKAFSQYISPAVLEELSRDPEKLKLGGERRDVTVLFSDIRGFTSISEKLDPEQLTGILNEYFTPMTDVIFRNGGTLDKYIGDAIMAFFGAPLEIKDHQAFACIAALEMLKVLGELKLKWREADLPDYIQQIDIGIGINSGIVSVGNMGSESRFDYTVMGDNVNLSSRLEGVNKSYGTNIIVSENVFRFTNTSFIFRELDRIRVAGKSVPITIYELIKRSDGGQSEKRLLELIGLFHAALALYRKRQWIEARGILEEILRENPQDRACRTFVERCSYFEITPPPEDWDGVFDRRGK